MCSAVSFTGTGCGYHAVQRLVAMPFLMVDLHRHARIRRNGLEPAHHAIERHPDSKRSAAIRTAAAHTPAVLVMQGRAVQMVADGTLPLHRTLYASEEHTLNIDP